MSEALSALALVVFICIKIINRNMNLVLLFACLAAVKHQVNESPNYANLSA